MKRGGLVYNWRDAWKWLSVQGLLILSIVPTIYENAGWLQDFIEPAYFRYGMSALGFVTLVARLVRQNERDC